MEFFAKPGAKRFAFQGPSGTWNYFSLPLQRAIEAALADSPSSGGTLRLPGGGQQELQWSGAGPHGMKLVDLVTGAENAVAQREYVGNTTIKEPPTPNAGPVQRRRCKTCGLLCAEEARTVCPRCGEGLPSRHLKQSQQSVLPIGWEERVHLATGRVFYVHVSEKKTQWERPPPPPLPLLSSTAAEVASPEERFERLKQMAEDALTNVNLAQGPITRFYKVANSLLAAVDQARRAGDLERSYVLLLRYTTFAIEMLPQHREYKNASLARERKELQACCLRALDELETLKATLRATFAREERLAKGQPSEPSTSPEGAGPDEHEETAEEALARLEAADAKPPAPSFAPAPAPSPQPVTPPAAAAAAADGTAVSLASFGVVVAETAQRRMDAKGDAKETHSFDELEARLAKLQMTHDAHLPSSDEGEDDDDDDVVVVVGGGAKGDAAGGAKGNAAGDADGAPPAIPLTTNGAAVGLASLGSVIAEAAQRRMAARAAKAALLPTGAVVPVATAPPIKRKGSGLRSLFRKKEDAHASSVTPRASPPKAPPSPLPALPVPEAGAAETHAAVKSFQAFCAAVAAAEVVSTWRGVLSALRLSPDHSAMQTLNALAVALGPTPPYKLAKLLGQLHSRSEHEQYNDAAAKACASLRVLVVGAGPIGLRAAIELALVGVHAVTVREKRCDFSRLNVLHLWEWVATDLKELGLAVLDPSAFSSPDFLHIGTAQLQCSLLKICLLLGVDVQFGSEVTELPPASECDILVDASASRCPLFERSLGFSQEVVLKLSRTLGIVMHLVNGNTLEERRLDEGSWSSQYHQPLFNALEESGVALENFVYYRSTGCFSEVATHYVVMTTDVESLVACGALRHGHLQKLSELLGAANVDAQKLEAFARSAVGVFAPPLSSKPLAQGQGRGVTVFDFSERRQSKPAAAVTGTASSSSSAEGVQLALRVGDALQEPFWPEGLGINRGFLHVLDTADAVKSFATRPDEAGLAAIVERREALFTVTKRLGAHNRLTELKPEKGPSNAQDATSTGLAYRIDPRTRYARIPNNPPPPLY